MGVFNDFFARNYLSISKITWKMALSLKLPSKIFFSTQCIILLLFLLFSQIKIGGALWAPPPIKTKVWKHPIKSKVKSQPLPHFFVISPNRFMICHNLICLSWYLLIEYEYRCLMLTYIIIFISLFRGVYRLNEKKSSWRS